MQDTLASKFEQSILDKPDKDLWARVIFSFLKSEPLQASSIEELLLDALQGSIRTTKDQLRSCLKLFQVALLVYPHRDKYRDHIKNALRNALSLKIPTDDILMRSLIDLLGDWFGLSFEETFISQTEEPPNLIKHCYFLTFSLMLAYHRKDKHQLSLLHDKAIETSLFLDHKGLPWASLWQSEDSYSEKKTRLAFYLLYDCSDRLFDNSFFAKHKMNIQKYLQLDHTNISNTLPVLMEAWNTKHLSACDININRELPVSKVKPALGFVGFQSDKYSCFHVLSGSKAPIGALHYQDVRISAYGPQEYPIKNSDNFGVVRKSFSIKEQKKEGCFLSLPEQSKLRGWTSLANTNQWLELFATSNNENTTLEFYLRKPEDHPIAMAFYIQAECCEFAGDQIIYPKSLDHYTGSLRSVTFQGSSCSVSFATQFEEKVEIIPLVGEGYFWDADFLLAYPFVKDHGKLRLSISMN